MKEEIQQTVINPDTFKLIVSLGSFLFVSLIGIIVWMAQGLMKRVDSIKSTQEQDRVERAEMKGDINRLIQDIYSLRTGLSEIPHIKETLIKHTSNIEAMQELLKEYRLMTLEHSKLFRELEKRYYDSLKA